MLNQFIREPSYYIVGFVWKLRGCCRSKKSKPPVLTNEPKQISSSSKTVLFIRHGQGDHNASLPGWNLVDPPLNATGLGQARDLHERLGGTSGPLKDVEVVLVSPLTRAFQTAQGAFGHGPAFQNREPTLKPKWVVCPLLRERMGAPCDEGRPKAQLAMTMPEMKEMEGFDTMKPDVWWTPHFEFGLYDRIAELEEQARGAAPLASRTAPLTAPLAASLPRSPPHRSSRPACPPADPLAPRVDDRRGRARRPLHAHPGLPPPQLRPPVDLVGCGLSAAQRCGDPSSARSRGLRSELGLRSEGGHGPPRPVGALTGRYCACAIIACRAFHSCLADAVPPRAPCAPSTLSLVTVDRNPCVSC